MANPNMTDMTEEDAADLQFPKDCASSNKPGLELEVSVDREQIFASGLLCYTCKSRLTEPYIRCANCLNIELCPFCFSNGYEKGTHKNHHDYIIVRNEFPLIENSEWTAREEMELMDLLLECGYGNWTDIAIRLKKSPEECKMHYLKHYIDNQSLPGLPKIKETVASLFSQEPVPYMFKLEDIEEPPRFGNDTLNKKLLAGYNPARADFEVNFDNYAELIVSTLKYDEFSPEDSDHELGQSLQVALFSAYNNRLQERMRRHTIIRNHGLISCRRTVSSLYRYDATITRTIAERLTVFMQLLSGMQFDFLMEGLHRTAELKSNITKLIDYRKNGLKNFHSIPIYKRLLKLRQENEKERRLYTNNLDCNWESILPTGEVSSNATTTVTSLQRKVAPPLEINGLPGYDKLASPEKELCSTARVVPASYLDFKNILIAESKKMGNLKLAQARTLLKIDVNKTRKIYDFLTSQGYINKHN